MIVLNSLNRRGHGTLERRISPQSSQPFIVGWVVRESRRCWACGRHENSKPRAVGETVVNDTLMVVMDALAAALGFRKQESCAAAPRDDACWTACCLSDSPSPGPQQSNRKLGNAIRSRSTATAGSHAMMDE